MSVFVHVHLRRAALVAAALVACTGRARAQADGGTAAVDGGVEAGRGGGVEAALDGGPEVITYIDPGCGCRTFGSKGDARGVGVVAALLALARRRNRSRHSLR